MSYSFVTPSTAARQAPLSMGFPRQEYWSALPLPSPGNLPAPGKKLTSTAWQAEYLPLNHLQSLKGTLGTYKRPFYNYFHASIS